MKDLNRYASLCKLGNSPVTSIGVHFKRVYYSNSTDGKYYHIQRPNNSNITDTTLPKSIIPYIEYTESRK